MGDEQRTYEDELRRRLLAAVLGGMAFFAVSWLIGGDSASAAVGGLVFTIIGGLLAPAFAKRRTRSPEGDR